MNLRSIKGNEKKEAWELDVIALEMYRMGKIDKDELRRMLSDNNGKQISMNTVESWISLGYDR